MFTIDELGLSRRTRRARWRWGITAKTVDESGCGGRDRHDLEALRVR
jgi:hypothetical protein